MGPRDGDGLQSQHRDYCCEGDTIRGPVRGAFVLSDVGEVLGHSEP